MSDVAPLLPGEVQVVHVALGAPAPVERLSRHLAPDERTRAARFRFERDRTRFVVSRGVLRELIGRHLGVPPARVAFRYGAQGKPSILEPADGTWLRFNVSHSGDMAVLALARERELGVDVERLRDDIAAADLTRRFFSAREQRALAGLPDAERLPGFFRVWTCKEAFVKATGEGVSRPLQGFDVVDDVGRVELRIDGAPDEAARWSLHALPVATGYAAALALEGAPVRVAAGPWVP